MFDSQYRPTLHPLARVSVFNKNLEQWVLANPYGQHWVISQKCADFLQMLDGKHTLEDLDLLLQSASWNELYQCSAQDVVQNLGVATFCLQGFSDDKAPVVRNKMRLSLDMIEAKSIQRISMMFRWLFLPFFAIPLVGFSLIAVALNIDKLVRGSHHGILHVSPLLFILAILFSGPLHEFGHIVASERFGRSPGKIGVGLYWAMPVMYVDLTSIWSLPRRERILVNLGGMYFQLAGAGLLSFAGLLLHQMDFRLIAIGYALSACANINPLMRYDGYWCVCDWIGVPNLRTQSHKAVWRTLKKGLGGGSSTAVSVERPLVLAYGFFSIAFFSLFIISSLRSFVYLGTHLGLEYSRSTAAIHNGSPMVLLQVVWRMATAAFLAIFLIQMMSAGVGKLKRIRRKVLNSSGEPSAMFPPRGDEMGQPVGLES